METTALFRLWGLVFGVRGGLLSTIFMGIAGITRWAEWRALDFWVKLYRDRRLRAWDVSLKA